MVLYGVLLLVSHCVSDGARRPAPGDRVETVLVQEDTLELADSTHLAWVEAGRSDTVVLLIHGSPGDRGAVDDLIPLLESRYRVIAPDLPGFGSSADDDLPDYSIVAHAAYLLQLLDSLQVSSVHAVGFSMGGGVALTLWDQAPARVRSVTLLSSIGVQELELLGDYYVNRGIHALQLIGLWLLHEATPHMGLLDDFMLDVPYARTFYDTDQRPLRAIMSRLDVPLLLVHGRGDQLVPLVTAQETHRLVPQSELVLFDGDHFLAQQQAAEVAPVLADFVSRVEAGIAVTRALAEPARIDAAARPFDSSRIPELSGLALLVAFLLIAAATAVSEDLTCIGTGLLIARGTISFPMGALACFTGIYVTDIVIYWLGRGFGRKLLRHPPLRWMIHEADIRRSAQWFGRRGFWVILATRLLPGTRIATYFTVGLMGIGFGVFALYMAIAVGLWVPLLVGLTSIFGQEVDRWLQSLGGGSFWLLIALAVTIFVVVRLGGALASWRGRRLLRHRWLRLTRWEYWPPAIQYVPLVPVFLYLVVRHRTLAPVALAVRHRGPATTLEPPHREARCTRCEDGSWKIEQLVERRVPRVEADGSSTLEELILRDATTLPIARQLFQSHLDDLSTVPPSGSVALDARYATRHTAGPADDPTRAAINAALRDVNSPAALVHLTGAGDTALAQLVTTMPWRPTEICAPEATVFECLSELARYWSGVLKWEGG